MTPANQLQALGALFGLVGSIVITLPGLSALKNQKQSIRVSDLEGGNDATNELIAELKKGIVSDAKVVIAWLGWAHIVGLAIISCGFFLTLAGLVLAG